MRCVCLSFIVIIIIVMLIAVLCARVKGAGKYMVYDSLAICHFSGLSRARALLIHIRLLFAIVVSGHDKIVYLYT